MTFEIDAMGSGSVEPALASTPGYPMAPTPEAPYAGKVSAGCTTGGGV